MTRAVRPGEPPSGPSRCAHPRRAVASATQVLTPTPYRPSTIGGDHQGSTPARPPRRTGGISRWVRFSLRGRGCCAPTMPRRRTLDKNQDEEGDGTKARVAVGIPAYAAARLGSRARPTAGGPHVRRRRRRETSRRRGLMQAIQVLTLRTNQGVGAAILTGHEHALVLGADVSVIMAGDAQMDPEFLPKPLDPIASVDAQITKGTRFYARGSFDGMSLHRIAGNAALSFLTMAASGYWNLFDPLNGWTAISRGALLRLDIKQVQRRHEFENDLLIQRNILRAAAVDGLARHARGPGQGSDFQQPPGP